MALLALLLATAVIGAACSSKGSTSASSTTTPGSKTTASSKASTSSGDSQTASLPDPCSLLSAQDFNSATSDSFGEGKPNTQQSNATRRRATG